MCSTKKGEHGSQLKEGRVSMTKWMAGQASSDLQRSDTLGRSSRDDGSRERDLKLSASAPSSSLLSLLLYCCDVTLQKIFSSSLSSSVARAAPSCFSMVTHVVTVLHLYVFAVNGLSYGIPFLCTFQSLPGILLGAALLSLALCQDDGHRHPSGPRCCPQLCRSCAWICVHWQH
jgi:hypothetical protein